MAAPVSNDELTDIILKSGVIEEPRLKQYLSKLENAPADPAQLSGLMIRDGILTNFQAEQLLQGKWKRFFIGKYKVLEKLGVGGMGQVFLCEHKLMKRRVAVKVLPAAKAQDAASLSRFYREARAVAAVDHPNIVRAYDIDEDNGLHFLVMEFVDGSNLYDMVRKNGPMEVLRACHYIYGSAVGLHHAHEMGLIHRDIKPANILVDRSGVVKILDLGLARFFNPDEDDMLTKKFDENVLGTADYLAPEQALDSHTVDIRADIYGLGGTFYYLLTGSPPFPEGTVAQKLLWHQTKDPRPVRELRPDVPPELAAILSRMMAKNPSDRFSSPAELMAALGLWVQTPIGPPPVAEMPQFSLAAVGVQRGNAASSSQSHSGTFSVSGQTVSLSPFAPAPFKPAPVTPPPVIPNGWESFAADTLVNDLSETRRTGSSDNAVATGQTSRRKKGSRSATQQKGNPRKSSKLWIYLSAGAVLLGVAVAAILVTKPWASGDTTQNEVIPPPPQHTNHAELNRWYVTTGSTSPNAATTRKSLSEAIKSARSGDTIVILDDRIEGPALIVPSTINNLRIEAGNGTKSVLWTYKPEGNTVAHAVLDIKSGEGVTVEGLTIDAGGKHDVGVHLSGYCDGATLDRITVRNAKRYGIRLSNIEAKAKALRIQNCRVSASPSGVALVTTGRLVNKNITISGCRFDAVESALAVEGPGESIEFRNNRVFNSARGVLLSRDLLPDLRLQLLIEQNTFQTLRESGLNFEVALANKNQDIQVNRNFFANTVALAVGLPSISLKAASNGMDAASKEGPIALKAFVVPDFAFTGLDPNETATFLRSNGRLAAVGPAKVSIGAE